MINLVASCDYFDRNSALQVLSLDLSNNRIKDLSLIGQFKNLKDLNLRGNPID